jgi:UDP-N-acetylglucosamine--dolichyl-phosphate N-acetylglucosaminephosphotransferase
MLGTVLVGVLKIWGEGQAMTVHLAVLVSVMGTILLGFADDMLELPWRYKLLFPFFAVLPLLAVYDGITHVEVIAPFSWFLGEQLELGKLYLLYIVLLGIYQTNTINIFAGINGLEVGQSIVAAAGLLVYFWLRSLIAKPSSNDAYAIWLLVVFLGTAVALMRLNAYPARIFIGDTFCYFAGIVLATAAVLGTSLLIQDRRP